MTTIKR